MAVKTYSLKEHGNTKLSTNFTVKEFARKDSSDTQKSGVVKYDVSIYDTTKSIYAWHSLPSTFNVEAGISEIDSD